MPAPALKNGTFPHSSRKKHDAISFVPFAFKGYVEKMGFFKRLDMDLFYSYADKRCISVGFCPQHA